MKNAIIFLLIVLFTALPIFSVYAAGQKLSGTFIILKVDNVCSLQNSQDQEVIMERALQLLGEKIEDLKLKSAELRRKSKDIIILSYQGSQDPLEVSKELQPKDLVVSFTAIGVFKGQQIS